MRWTSQKGTFLNMKIRDLKIFKLASHPVLGPESKTSHTLVDESFEDDSLTRFSNKPGPDDSWPLSDEDDYNFGNKNVPKINLTELWAAAQRSKQNMALEKQETSWLDDSILGRKNKDVVETLPKTSINVQNFSQSSFLSPSHDTKEATFHSTEWIN